MLGDYIVAEKKWMSLGRFLFRKAIDRKPKIEMKTLFLNPFDCIKMKERTYKTVIN